MLTMPNGGQNVQPHWGNLESRLTRLKLNLDHEIGHATVSALNEPNQAGTPDACRSQKYGWGVSQLHE